MESDLNKNLRLEIFLVGGEEICNEAEKFVCHSDETT